jgi:hypothetical protein
MRYSLRPLKRTRTETPLEDHQPTRVVTIRMPKDLHDALRSEAHGRRTSMNRLCLQFLHGPLDASADDASDADASASEMALAGAR